MGHMEGRIAWGIVAAIISAGLLIAEDYFPWKRIRRGRSLPRIPAYVLGMLAILDPFTAWACSFGYGLAAVVLWAITIVGGAAVMGCYLLDRAWTQASRKIQTRD